MKQENSEIGKKVLTDGLDPCPSADFEKVILFLGQSPKFYKAKTSSCTKVTQ